MCGIIGYIGKRNSYDVVIKGLKRLEYRGYDSTGVAFITNDTIQIIKKKGKVSDLENFIGESLDEVSICIGHTRWATHGEPNDKNAHPHFSSSNKLCLIHNGIIENYHSIKVELEQKGHVFSSDTDTEVLIHFIEDIQSTYKLSLEEAIRQALCRVVGAYAIVILSAEHSDSLFAARKGSPLVIGLGDNELFIASDATPLIEYTSNVIYLDDEQFGRFSVYGYEIRNLTDELVIPEIHQVDMELEAIEKGGYEHFMQKEIFEQPISVAETFRGRLNARESRLTLGGINKYAEALLHARKITFLACGTSWHAGLVAEYIFEELCRIPVEVEYASEFRYRNPVIQTGDICIAISQSGETADTLAAIELAKQRGAIVLGVVNVVGSSIARATHEGAYLHTGPEIGVASTKAFTAQVSVLIMIALRIAHQKGTISYEKYQMLLIELENLPVKIKTILNRNNEIYDISRHFYQAPNFLFLGRGVNFPVALEGALKLKEISYIHAEGYPAAEMKHGPIALIDHEMPTVFIALQDSGYEKILSNIQEVKARKGKVIAIVTEGDQEMAKIADYTVEIPKVSEMLSPILSVVPLQLLAYHIAILRDCNVDQPRNLAKSVTVE